MSRRTEALELLGSCLSDSHDPDTQTGCVIDSGRKFTSSSNRLPVRVPVTAARLVRPAKYRFVMHAERRAIATAARNGTELRGATAYSNWFPCAECAGSLIQAGIIRVVCDRAAYEKRKDDPAYAFSESMEMLAEAGVKVEWI